MKKLLFAVACVFSICACNSTNPPDPSGEIYAPITQVEINTITAKFNKNRDCIKGWLGEHAADSLYINKISAAQQIHAHSVARHTSICFGETYAVDLLQETDGEYIDNSYLKQRIFIVAIPSEIGDWLSYVLLFDKYYNLIPVPLSPEEECGCDCWQD